MSAHAASPPIASRESRRRLRVRAVFRHAGPFVCLLTCLGFMPGLQPAVRAGTDAADWPMFRGDAALSGVARTKLPDRLRVRWRFSAGDAFESTAAIVSDTVYVGCDDGHLYAIALETGKARWSYAAVTPSDAESRRSMSDGPASAPAASQPARAAVASRTGGAEPNAIRSSPAVFEGMVFFGDDDGVFHALDARNGRAAWTFPTGAQIISSPVPADGRVIFGSYDGFLYCLSPRDGKLIWRYETEDRVHGTPSVADGRAMVAGCDGRLHVVDVRDGARVAEVPIGSPSGSAAARLGSRAFIGTFGNQVLGIDCAAETIAWAFEDRERQQPYYASPAVSDHRVFIGGRDKLLRAFDAGSGEVKWTFRAGGRIDSSPVLCGGRLYFGASDGVLYVLNAADGREVQRFEAGDGISASPAIGRGRIVIGTEGGTLYCLGE